MEKHEFNEAARVQQSLLASTEKKILVWCAQRMPPWIHSDHLTALGFAGMVLAGVSYRMAAASPGFLLLATLFLWINWFGDSMDGTLARVRNKLRPRYGFYVDHMLDTFGSVFLLAGLGSSGYMNPVIAAGLLIAYLILSAEIYLATYALRTFQISYGKWGPTELRILLTIGNLYLFHQHRVHLFGKEYLLFDVGGAAGIIGLLVIAILSFVRHTITLYNEEKLE